VAIAQSADDKGTTKFTKSLEGVLSVRLYVKGLQPYRSVAKVKMGSLLAANYVKDAETLCIQVTMSRVTS
jgi:hypothetical protein